MKTVSIPLITYMPMKDWRPQLQDFIIWHGWFKHWFGVVYGIEKDSIKIFKAGLPTLLCQMNEKDRLKNMMELKIVDVANCSPGEYAIVRGTKESTLWFV